MTINEIIEMSKTMGEYSLVTIKLFALTLIFSSVLGLIIALGRMSKLWIIRWPVQFFLLIMRGTPLMLQLIFFFFGLKFIGIEIDRFPAAVLAFTLNYAAYISEIYRSGIESIPRGQYEAATILGFSRARVFMKIILPQVIKRIVPPFSNEMMVLIKDTALVQVISVMELFSYAKKMVSFKGTIMPLIIAAVFYLAMNIVLTAISSYTEKKLSYYR